MDNPDWHTDLAEAEEALWKRVNIGLACLVAAIFACILWEVGMPPLDEDIDRNRIEMARE